MNISNKNKIRLFIIVWFLCYVVTTWSQNNKTPSFLFQGVVYGYNYEPTKKLLRKNKQFIIEGLLSGVTVTIYNKNNLVYTETTNENGQFSVPIPINGIFKLEISKEGYEKNILLINSRAIPKKKISRALSFTGAEFMLNSYKNKTSTDARVLGILYYNSTKGYFEFLQGEKGSKKTDNALDLIKKAVLKNQVAPLPSVSDTSGEPFRKKTVTEFELAPAGVENISAEDIPLRRNEIEKSKAQLQEDKRHALSKEDSLIIDAKETVILAAEVELQNALQLIGVQKSEIKYQKRGLYAILGFLLLLAGSLVILFIYYKDKKRTNQVLAAQHKNIVDSITYAKRIQQSILVDEEEIKKVLPDFFIYYQPKDIVSGDFYWFSHIDGCLILAVVDCTGHGVPGAFMSLIANTLLNEIVNEKHITNPAFILKHLHKGITEALHQEKDNSWSYDGMDMSLCVIDSERKKISYAGAMHPLYIVTDHKVDVVTADMYSIGGRKLRSSAGNTREFTNHTIEVKQGMSFYMFSDGYVDQFGGNETNKFSTERFKQLLLDMQGSTMEKQKEIVQHAMQEWRGSHKQIDDMLVMGMRI